jgi:hypothetical protein
MPNEMLIIVVVERHTHSDLDTYLTYRLTKPKRFWKLGAYTGRKMPNASIRFVRRSW